MNDDPLLLERSVIRIIGKDGKTTCGTGFLVAENIAVTCAHVIGIAGAKQGTPVQFKFDGSDEVQWATVDEAHFSPGSVDDVAYLILNRVPDQVRPLPLASAKKSDGHPYKSYGYPAEAEPVKARKPTASINGVVPASEPDVQPLLEVKGEEWGHGLSGAPIFDLSYQAVVGMVTQGKKLEKTQLGYSTTADTICLHHPGILLDKAPLPGLPSLPPQTILPDPAPLPSGSRMPFIRNNLFIGREEDLKALAAELLYSTTGRNVALTQPVAAAGMGGIGKTQLAVEFCYRYGQFCEGVHWINAANPDAIGAEIAACGMIMGIQPWSDKQPEQVEFTLRGWAMSKRRIVVLDNLEEPSVLAEWLPRLQNVHVLTTTRLVKWPPELGLRVQRLERFPKEESLRLLQKLCPRLSQEPEEAISELAEVLCNLPLAVDLAGRYLNERKSFSLNQYIDSLNSSGVLNDYAMNDEGANDTTRHLKSLEATFEMSWMELDAPEKSRKAKEMHFARLAFRCAGYCAPTAVIASDLLRDAVREVIEPEGDVSNFDPAFERGMAHLTNLGLLEAAEGGVTIHPLLAEFARGKDADLPVDEGALPHLANALISASFQANETGLPAKFQHLRPHLETAALYAEGSAPETVGKLWNNLGLHLQMVADFDGSKRFHTRSLRQALRSGEENPPLVAIYANNLGLALHATGDLDGAKAYFKIALKIAKKVYEEEDPQIGTYLNNLGSALLALGDLERAKVCFKKALKIAKKVYGNEDPKVAICYSNMGTVLQAQGELTRAKAYYKGALRIHMQVYGLEHPAVAIDASNLGLVLQALGDLDEAKVQTELALRIHMQVYGLEHPSVATQFNNLAGVYDAYGNLIQAKENYERAISILVKLFPENHPDIITFRKNLSAVEAELNARNATE